MTTITNTIQRPEELPSSVCKIVGCANPASKFRFRFMPQAGVCFQHLDDSAKDAIVSRFVNSVVDLALEYWTHTEGDVTLTHDYLQQMQAKAKLEIPSILASLQRIIEV